MNPVNLRKRTEPSLICSVEDDLRGAVSFQIYRPFLRLPAIWTVGRRLHLQSEAERKEKIKTALSKLTKEDYNLIEFAIKGNHLYG